MNFEAEMQFLLDSELRKLPRKKFCQQVCLAVESADATGRDVRAEVSALIRRVHPELWEELLHSDHVSLPVASRHDAEIATLYRSLWIASSRDDSLEYQRLLGRIRDLEKDEDAEMERRFQAWLPLKPGDSPSVYARAATFLSTYGVSPPPDASASEPD